MNLLIMVILLNKKECRDSIIIDNIYMPAFLLYSQALQSKRKIYEIGNSL